jgi:hypothetical protein
LEQHALGAQYSHESGKLTFQLRLLDVATKKALIIFQLT